MNNHRIRHADLVLRLAEQDHRLLDALATRPHLMNPYPNIVKRLARRSRKFRRGLAGHRAPTVARPGEPRVQPLAERAHHLTLVATTVA